MPKDFYERMWQTIKTEKKAFVGDVRNVKKDGTEYWQELYISPILDKNGTAEFFIGIEPNITDRKRKERLCEEFVSMVSHQIRNPLTSIRWILELLLENTALPEDVQRELHAAHDTSQELSSIVADLLTLTRAEKDAMCENCKDENFSDLVVDALAHVTAQHPRIDFSFSSSKKRFPVRVNKTFASQIFMNILSNAAEYSDPASGQVDVVVKKLDDGILFSCHNNGPVIAPADKPHIFTKFFRTENAKKRRKSGTGLGLFIAKTIADNLHWKVWFESEPQKGTTFYVHAPLEVTSASSQ